MEQFYFLFAFLAAAILGFLFLPTIYYKYLHPQTFQTGPSVENVSEEKAMMLTFDDGPDSLYTEQLLDILALNDIKATFFLVAEKAAAHPEVVKRICREGHAIGFHGMTHKNMAFQGFFATKRNFEKGLSLLRAQLASEKDVLTPDITYYRPPYGFLNPFTIYFAKRSHLTPVFWNIITQDWSAKSSSDTILDKLRREAQNGRIILLHDSGEGTGGAPGAPQNTLVALYDFLPEMKAKGYRFILPDQSNLRETDGRNDSKNRKKLRWKGAYLHGQAG